MLLKADNGTPPAGGGTEEEWWKTGTCNAAHPAATLGVSLLGSSSGNSASPTTCATWNTSASIHPVTNCSPYLAPFTLLFKYDDNWRLWNLPKAFHNNFSFEPHYSPNKTQHWHKICSFIICVYSLVASLHQQWMWKYLRNHIKYNEGTCSMWTIQSRQQKHVECIKQLSTKKYIELQLCHLGNPYPDKH